MNRYQDRHLTVRPTIYRQHTNCTANHRGWKTLGECVWPDAARRGWVAGRGQWAVVAYCRVTTVTLFEDEAEARNQMGVIDATACGGQCNGRHQLIWLADGLVAGVRKAAA